MKRYIRFMTRGGHVLTAYILSFLLIGSLAGCGAGQKAADSRPPETQAQFPDKDEAMRHFIDGSVSEAKGDYARAVVEFQDALLYDEDPAIHHALAKNYLELDKPSLAVQHAVAALREAPENPHYHELLGDIYLKMHLPDSAAAEYEKVLALNPSDVQSAMDLAMLYAPHKPMRALGILNALRDEVGDEWNLLFQIGQLYRELGKQDSALMTLEAMLRLDPGNVTLRSTLAEMYFDAKDYGRARDMYRDLLERDPGNTRATIALAETERREGNWKQAAALYDALIDQDTLNLDAKMEIGEALVQFTLSDSTARPHALSILARLRDKFPDDWRPYWYIGGVQFNAQRYTEALESFSKGLEKDEKNGRLLDLAARTCLALDQYDRARALLERAVALDPENADLLSLLGFAYSRLGRKEETVETLRRCLRIEPAQMDALSTLALTLDGMERFTLSDSLYEAGLALYESKKLSADATYYLLLNNYAYSLSERDLQLNRALEMSRKAIDSEKENSSYLDTYGWILHKLGKQKEALDYIQRAIDLREKNTDSGATLYEHKGDILFRLGEAENARKAWKQALAADPTNTMLQDKITNGLR